MTTDFLPALCALFALAACTTPAALPPIDSGGGNPASLYCQSRGGTLAFRDDAGYCTLPDGRVVEEWTLYRTEAGR